MDIVYTSPECFPYTSASSGLSHLVFSLSREVEKHGHNVKVFLPRYSSIDPAGFLIEQLPSDFHVSFEKENIQLTVYKGILPDSLVSVFLLDSQNYFASSKEIYLDDKQDLKRFQFFKEAVSTVISHLKLEPDVIHAFGPHGLDFTISTSQENIKGNIKLIECGIDKTLYNPECDTEIAQNFSMVYFSLGKRKCKEDLLEILELENDVHIPIFTLFASPDENLNIFISSLKELLHFNLYLILFGEPDSLYKQELQGLQTEYKNIRLVSPDDYSLLKKIYAGSDFLFLIDQKEISAIPVLIGARYGAVPVAYNTGANYLANGILFEEFTEEGLLTGVERALMCYRDKELWTKIVKEVMSLDYDIRETAKMYLGFYYLPKTVAAE